MDTQPHVFPATDRAVLRRLADETELELNRAARASPVGNGRSRAMHKLNVRTTPAHWRLPCPIPVRYKQPGANRICNAAFFLTCTAQARATPTCSPVKGFVPLICRMRSLRSSSSSGESGAAVYYRTRLSPLAQPSDAASAARSAWIRRYPYVPSEASKKDPILPASPCRRAAVADCGRFDQW